MGVGRTWSFIRQLYMGFANILTGRISFAKHAEGPLGLAEDTFEAAQDPFTLTLWLGLISVNLAVVNFLPIPVLDGGHMVFLIYELIRRRPPSDAVRAVPAMLVWRRSDCSCYSSPTWTSMAHVGGLRAAGIRPTWPPCHLAGGNRWPKEGRDHDATRRPPGDEHSAGAVGPAAPPAETPAAPEAPKAAGMSWGWRVALFIWITAFVCLLAYELLNTLVRSLAAGWGAK